MNEKPVWGFSLFWVKITKFKKNIWEPVIENVIILGHLMANTSSKQQKIYIFCGAATMFEEVR